MITIPNVPMSVPLFRRCPALEILFYVSETFGQFCKRNGGRSSSVGRACVSWSGCCGFDLVPGARSLMVGSVSV